MSNRTDPKQPSELTPTDEGAVLQAAAEGIHAKIVLGMRQIACLWAVMILCMTLGGFWFFNTQVEDARVSAIDMNRALANSKAVDIASWLTERMSDAYVLSNSQFLIQGINDWLGNPQLEDTKKVLSRFRSLQKEAGYSEILLVDAYGNIKLSLTEAPEKLEKETLQVLASVLNSHQTGMTDLYLNQSTGKPRLDLVAPLFERISGQEKCVGAIVLVIDPEVALYPKIQQIPFHTETAETLLVRRDGDSVLWLNDLRFEKGVALKKRQPLTETERPAVQAVLGKKGVFLGEDYRGKKVIAFLSNVPDSPWFIVSKIDIDEIFERIPPRVISFLFVTTVLLSGAVIITIMMRRRLLDYAKLLENEIRITKDAVKLEKAYKDSAPCYLRTTEKSLTIRRKTV
jgi:hypothetical protein